MPGKKPRALSLRSRAFSRNRQTKVLRDDTLRILERRYRVWEMRKQGHTLKQISDALGVPQPTLHQDLVVVAQRLTVELKSSVEQDRELAVERLDNLVHTFFPEALGDVLQGVKPSLAAAQVVLQIEARRAKLLALDVPETKKHEVSGIREYVGVNVDDV